MDFLFESFFPPEDFFEDPDLDFPGLPEDLLDFLPPDEDLPAFFEDFPLEPFEPFDFLEAFEEPLDEPFEEPFFLVAFDEPFPLEPFDEPFLTAFEDSFPFELFDDFLLAFPDLLFLEGRPFFPALEPDFFFPDEDDFFDSDFLLFPDLEGLEADLEPDLLDGLDAFLPDDFPFPDLPDDFELLEGLPAFLLFLELDELLESDLLFLDGFELPLLLDFPPLLLLLELPDLEDFAALELFDFLPPLDDFLPPLDDFDFPNDFFFPFPDDEPLDFFEADFFEPLAILDFFDPLDFLAFFDPDLDGFPFLPEELEALSFFFFLFFFIFSVYRLIQFTCFRASR